MQMDLDGESTTIDHLFSAEPAAAPAPEPATEQPLPPDVAESYQAPQPVAAEPPAPPAPEAVPPQPQQHLVPLAELIETRKRAQFAEETARQAQEQARQLNEAMRRFTQPQQPQAQPKPVIDPEIDPRGAFEALREEQHQGMLNMRLDMSERYAREKFGDAAVDAATQAAVDAGYNQVFVSRPDAYKEMMDWHQGQQVRQQIGTDPAAYERQVEERVRAKVIAEMRAGTPPPSNLPPSLSTATRVNGGPEVAPNSRDFFKDMMNPKAR
jgi:hypothetical protein